MKVCCWDLEGPISHVDFAAELFPILESRLKRPNLAEFFMMISIYDDYLIDHPDEVKNLGIESYEPGDTLRLLAPFYIWYFTDEELVKISQGNPGMIPGIGELMKNLKENWEIFIISTSYSQHAHGIAARIGVNPDHVYCTTLDVAMLKPQLNDLSDAIQVLIDQVFNKYVNRGKMIEQVVDDLNSFFWKSGKSSYSKVMNQVIVRGGRRKAEAVLTIAERTGHSIKDMVATGDSITDKDMLELVMKEGGIAISFNGNEYCVPKANVAVTSPNAMGSAPIFHHHPDIWDFVS
ncbi:MAG: HAD hydrolase family protein, partial [Candidatus Helarchaeota archaeon]